MITAIPQVNTSDRVLSQIQQNIVQPVNQLLKNPVMQGNLLKNISISSGTNVIAHGLDRTMQGWIVADVNASVTLYRSAALNSQTLTLTSSGSATVSLYVF